MDKKIFDLHDIKKIGIFRALFLGDLLCSLPALRAIKKTFPKSTITLIGLPWAIEFVNRYPFYIDEFIEFPGFPGIPEKKADMQKLQTLSQNASFDLLIQMHGNGGISNNFIKEIPSTYILGYANEKEITENECFLEYPNEDHEIIKWLKLLQGVNIISRDTSLLFPINQQEEKEAEVIREKFQLHKFIIIHVGAKDKKRKWKTEYFAIVADLLSQIGYQIVFTGISADTVAVREVQKLMTAESVDITGYTSIGALACLLRDSKLVITNDTGISHVAAAVQARSIVIFTPYSSPAQWAPLNADLHVAIPAIDALPSTVYNTASLILGHRNKLTYIPQKEVLV